MLTRSRVAHVVLSLDTGGLERFVCNLAACEPMRDLPPLVICLDRRGNLAEVVEAAGGTVLLLERGDGFNPQVIFRLARILREAGVTAVHSHSLDAMLYAGFAALLAGIPNRIHTQHNTQLRSYTVKDRMKFRLAAWACSTVAAVSGETAREVEAHGANPRKVRVIPNGIDADHFGKGLVVRSGGRRIGCVARLSPEKGIDRLISAFAAVVRRMPDARLTIVGEGEERPALEARVRELGLGESVEFLGFQDDVAAALGTFDLFVLPSLTEGIPLALLEAMAAGLPVIATRVGGVPEVIEDGTSGVLVEAGNAIALELAMLDLLFNPARLAALGAGARERIRRHFNLNRMALQYRELYVQDPASPLWRRALRRILRFLPSRWILWSGKTESPHVALTFDDGPDAESTPRILDLLKHYGARATFFLVGERAAAQRGLVRRILDEGHEIGNHSFSHADFGTLLCREAMREIERTEAVLAPLAGKASQLFRPPKGRICLSSLVAAWRKRMTVVLWSVDLKDFRAQAPDEIAQALRRSPIRPGDIILYHGTNSAALDALPLVLEEALNGSRKAVSVSQMRGL